MYTKYRIEYTVIDHPEVPVACLKCGSRFEKGQHVFFFQGEGIYCLSCANPPNCQQCHEKPSGNMFVTDGKYVCRTCMEKRFEHTPLEELKA